MGGIAALITPPLAAHGCEIPAFAGMVFRGTGNRRRIRQIVAHDTVRFLPSQEWSVGGRGFVGGFWRLRRHRKSEDTAA